MVSSGKVPLRLLTLVRLIVSASSFFVGIVFLLLKLFNWDAHSIGVAPLLIGIVCFSAVPLFCLGIVSGSIRVIFDHVRNRWLGIKKTELTFNNA